MRCLEQRTVIFGIGLSNIIRYSTLMTSRVIALSSMRAVSVCSVDMRLPASLDGPEFNRQQCSTIGFPLSVTTTTRWAVVVRNFLRVRLMCDFGISIHSKHSTLLVMPSYLLCKACNASNFCYYENKAMRCFDVCPQSITTVLHSTHTLAWSNDVGAYW